MILIYQPAQADWAILGVATRCDQKNGTFEVSPVVELSSVDPGAVPVKQGFKRLAKGTNKLICKLGKNTVHSTIRLYEPTGRGMCMGAGYVVIDKFRFGKNELIRYPEPFNWKCTHDPILVKFLIYQTGSQNFLERCTAEDWGWRKGFSGVKCDTTKIR